MKFKGIGIAIAVLGLMVVGFYLASEFLGTQKTVPADNIRITNEQILENTKSEEQENKPPKLAEENSRFYVAGWIANWDTQDGYSSYTKNEVINSISPTWYYLAPDATLALKSGARTSINPTSVHQEGDTIIPSISNSSETELSAILNNATSRQKLVGNVASEVLKYNYDGIDIDFENIKSDDKDEFGLFIQELSSSLHSKNKVLTIAVLPKTDELIYSLDTSRNAQDWAKIGQYVDEFRIMGYDFEHNSTTQAGAISSVVWLEEVLNYAITQVPVEKIVLGLPLYGYKWTSGAKTTSFTWASEQKWEKEWGVKGKLDEVSKEKTLKYENITLWYQDAESLEYRVALAKKYKIKGVVFWRLGNEGPEIWNLF